MTTFKKILCATDFSESAAAALQVASRLAIQAGAELEIVTAWSLPVTGAIEGYAFPGAALEQMIDDGRRGLEQAAAAARDAGVVRLSTKLLQGSAWDAVSAEAKQDPNVELVVVGTHGRSGLSRVLLGSVAERIVRHAPCSVLVVRPTDTLFQHVACPVDFGEPARFAADLAAKLTAPDGRGLMLLYALEMPVTFGTHTTPDFVAELDRRATKTLDDWKTNLRTLTTARVEIQQRIGTPAGQVLAMLDADPTYDLVVVGSHGRTGLKRLFLGSVAERIVRYAKPSVLVARARKES
jgi:nucleotide-binding universal stress UspA family protein